MNIAIVGSSGYIASALIRRMEQEASVGSILKIDRTRIWIWRMRGSLITGSWIPWIW